MASLPVPPTLTARSSATNDGIGHPHISFADTGARSGRGMTMAGPRHGAAFAEDVSHDVAAAARAAAALGSGHARRGRGAAVQERRPFPVIRTVLLSAVSLALAAYVGIAALLFAFQRSIVFVADITRPDAPAVGLPSLHEVRLQTPGGLRLLAWWVPPAPGRPVLAYLHGNGGNLGDRRDRLRRFARRAWAC